MISESYGVPPTSPSREIRAVYTAEAIRVYQAYSAGIAEPALAAGRFVAPFSRSRTTWIKPSFLWMMYRCGWASKPGQERVLAIDIKRSGFEWALAHACLSHYDPQLHASAEAWKKELEASPVRLQWDPERDYRLQPLQARSLQLGLGPRVVPAYVDEWILKLEDVTPLAKEIEALVRAGNLDVARALHPFERPYPLPQGVALHIGSPPAEGLPQT